LETTASSFGSISHRSPNGIAASSSRQYLPSQCMHQTLNILVVDVLLVTNARQGSTLIIIVGTLMATTVFSCGRTFFPGAMRIDFFTAANVEDEMVAEAWSCATPPCVGVAHALHNAIIFSLVFTLDYYFTRRFAYTARNAIEKAQQIAESLGNMDIDGASKLVTAESAEHLPPQLRTAFQDILRNLKKWQREEAKRRQKLEQERDRQQATVVVNAEGSIILQVRCCVLKVSS